MSEMAEFARRMHEAERAPGLRRLSPVEYPSRTRHLYDIRAVVFDIYGTLLDYWREEFTEPGEKERSFAQAFRNVAEYFGMIPALTGMNPADPPEKTLSDFYHGLISLRHEQATGRGAEYPEIVIEEIWELVVRILRRHGYAPQDEEGDRSFSRKIAWFYNFKALGRRLYPGVVRALESLRSRNMHMGLLSNAQFYTPIDLTLLIRDQSRGKYDDLFELFDVDLTFFSYEYGVAKPNQLLFRRLFDALYELQILPSQTVFVGNDLLVDIEPAQRAGMKTALFTGDERSAFLDDPSGSVIPDLIFSDWADLDGLLSFNSEGSP